MSPVFPDPLEVGKESYEKVRGAFDGATGQGLVDKSVNKITQGGVALVGEVFFQWPLKFALGPSAKLTGKAVKGAAKYAIDWTKVALASLPLIPAPGKTSKGDGTSIV